MKLPNSKKTLTQDYSAPQFGKKISSDNKTEEVFTESELARQSSQKLGLNRELNPGPLAIVLRTLSENYTTKPSSRRLKTLLWRDIEIYQTLDRSRDYKYLSGTF